MNTPARLARRLVAIENRLEAITTRSRALREEAASYLLGMWVRPRGATKWYIIDRVYLTPAGRLGVHGHRPGHTRSFTIGNLALCEELKEAPNATSE